MKVASIIGTRPEFIQAHTVDLELRKRHASLLIHTGQHYDDEMSAMFFKELDIPEPKFCLNVKSGFHGRQTGRMLKRIEPVLLEEQPDWVLVYGDTNSTLAGALAAAKLRIPLGHVEAGMRSFNREMPEEINRVIADHCADAHFCPTETAAVNLTQEGIFSTIYRTGDVTCDAVLRFYKRAMKSNVVQNLGLRLKGYYLATLHRPRNVDTWQVLQRILDAFAKFDLPVVFPVHPRVQPAMDLIAIPRNVKTIRPVGYLDMLWLEQNAKLILTDSGGVQKEAYLLGTPCVTLRDETEWVETVELGWNVLVGTDKDKILSAVNDRIWPKHPNAPIFGTGEAGKEIVSILEGL